MRVQIGGTIRTTGPTSSAPAAATAEDTVTRMPICVAEKPIVVR